MLTHKSASYLRGEQLACTADRGERVRVTKVKVLAEERYGHFVHRLRTRAWFVALTVQQCQRESSTLREDACEVATHPQQVVSCLGSRGAACELRAR